MEDRLTHIDENGRPRMVDVGEKADTKRLAVAKGSIYMHPETLKRVREGSIVKGDVLSVAQTAGIMAEETRAKRLVDENAAQIARFAGLARKALAAGNEADARVFLAKKQELAGRAEGLTVAYEGAKANADKMRQMHDKLVADIEELNARKATIKAKAAVAKTQSKVNEMTSAGDRAEGARSAFDRMEAKADEMLDRANAVAELSEKPADPTEELAKKYAAAGAEAAVDDDLARLKKEMGLE